MALSAASKRTRLNLATRYMLAGMAFGLLFPIFGTFLYAFTAAPSALDGGLLKMHLNQPLLLIIDTAPFVLGVFAFYIGRSHQHALIAQKRQRSDAESFGRQLQKQNGELQELNEVLDGLLYSASHDLKSPVVNLKSMVQMLRMVQGKPGQENHSEEILQRMENAVDRFDTTIENLLHVSRVDELFSGQHSLVSLQHSIKKVEAALQDQIKAHAARIRVDVAPDTQVLIPEAGLQFLLQNLLSNAIKYAVPGREPEVTFASSRSGTQVRLDVRDNGRGIDLEKNRDKLFKMFKRIEHQETGGIGLFLVKRIVDKAGGRIDVASTPGSGTCFSLYLPTH